MTTLIDKIENDKRFKFVRDNFSLIIFIPSLLGGLKQFFALLLYSPTLIQYFSFSQLAIDGLETIFQGIYVSIIISIIYYLIAADTKRISIFNIFNSIVLVLYTGYIFYSGNAFKIAPYNLTTLDTYLFKFITLTFLGITIGNELSNRRVRVEARNMFIKYFIRVSAIFLAIYFIVGYKPFQYNVKNVIDITNKVKKENSKDAELIYYNDSYLIFILNPKEDFNHRRFYVQKFETLFEEEKK